MSHVGNTSGPEHRAHDLLVMAGVDYYVAHELAFSLVNITADVEQAERSVVESKERRVELIRAAVEAGLSYRQVAQFVGLSHQRVAQIVTAGD